MYCSRNFQELKTNLHNMLSADMAELADAIDLGSIVFRREGSSPSVCIHYLFKSLREEMVCQKDCLLHKLLTKEIF